MTDEPLDRVEVTVFELREVASGRIGYGDTKYHLQLLAMAADEIERLSAANEPEAPQDIEGTTVPRLRGKPCTCDNCLGSSVPCRVDAGERLGELWYCRKAAESSVKAAGDA